METYHLPKQFPSQEELASINKRLRNEEIKLDWSNVTSDVQPAQLETLFAGMTLAEYFTVIGDETITDALMPMISVAFEAVADQATSQTNSIPIEDTASTPTPPPLWLPEPPSVAVVPRADPAPTHALFERQAVLSTPTSAAMRAELEAMVVYELLGPAGGEEEEIDEARVRDRYLVGMLAPGNVQIIPEEDEELPVAAEGDSEDGTEEVDVVQKPTFHPSSLGVSFCVDQETTELLVNVRWGQYQRGKSQVLKTERDVPRTVWQRTPRGGKARLLQIKEGAIPPWQPEKEEQPDVFVKGIVRHTNGNWLVSLFLVNGQHEPERLRDSAWLFQPEMIIEAPEGAPIFKKRPYGRELRLTKEDKAMAMLYQQHVSFAVGHGVGVHAETLPGDPTCAIRLSTRTIPSYDVPRVEAPGSDTIAAFADLVLDMKELAETSGNDLAALTTAEPPSVGAGLAPARDLAAKLTPLTTAYEQWIIEQEHTIQREDAHLHNYRDVAEEAMKQCRVTLERIRDGIHLLEISPEAVKAFSFMNRAMYQQRIHTNYVDEKRRGNDKGLNDLDIPKNRSWRPFQLAFILLNLPALTDLQHPERSVESSAIADLLWFPTGGGKTEAYLGLTAYTLAIRRLQGIVEGHSGLDGVAVIMRYTLRLLTLQQFQRASSLICACEMMRREDSRTWGETPFRLGLWVGQRSTPNTTEESAEANKQEHGMYSSHFGGVGSPRQLTFCPWCGSPIEGGKNIEVESVRKGRGRTLIYCSDAYGQCPFSKAKSFGEGLPVLVVDEEIYRLLPALLIATVDKFAQLPWKSETQMLFGRVEKKCSRHGFRAGDLEDSDTHPAAGNLPKARSIPHIPLRPPDLIIQDELHLISGPLGSLAGLYETVIDHLATWTVNGKEVRPKVVAATATIRRAKKQIHDLFLRTVNIFPPQGLDIKDNFFARQQEPSEETPGRRYIGICASGRRLKHALIRVYVAHLSAAQVLFEKYGEAADPWMTLVGYFNSMRELGGMRRLVDDDVTSRLHRMDKRGMAKRRKPIVEELTSRKSSTAIPEVLNRLEQTYQPEKWPIDVLLATNMISVGVDVKRLGLMIVTEQPKTTAEYIQASSRVGRSHPGLVCVVYNWGRPRDLSHYEQFEHYHATFYQQVEALSLTPFASRARDRGLAALLTSYIRLSGSTFNKNEDAGKVGSAEHLFTEAIEAITRRAKEITDDDESVEYIRQDLEKLRAYWLHKAETIPVLGYKERKDGKTLGLLRGPEPGKWEPFTCLNSLRDVEPTVNLVFDERELGDSSDRAANNPA